ncbi:MAG: tRNA lysidine(34) synthetase TilS [Pseudotabrizicola sp.]|uniref:tRNA lysidine(34) synthetase TilS n=1 Tax=Pseudotabrizicola sp. TaxID=2939647 RepID=UPI002730A250|nr:tRNA lysidine(34) synthetase TilS [Pseudotabrizicola sp.]MDP2080646.1 tRNA lysidine(34) synthetase TilS [Pseudotabrizicola sp.]MDZ7573375.1 tRNA lysidine(34) synthetase TilS [Pseudotabrizicola sp.]
MSDGPDRSLIESARRALSTVPGQGVVGLAVSGGGDSIAMLHLMAAVAQRPLAVATVDHRLRAEAAAEADQVAQVCAGLGVAHEVLVWSHGAVTGNLMDAARRARYGLLAQWAAARGISAVMVAHTADDQAETVLLGLARAAGLDGLTGMRPSWQQGGVAFHRPFLDATRADLRAYVQRRGLWFVDDPSNDDPGFDRVKMRLALASLHEVGITAPGLAMVARNLAAVQADLRRLVAEAAGRLVVERAGALEIDRAGFAALPGEVARRLVQAGLLWLSGADYAPRAEALARMVQALIGGRGATLWGCRLVHRTSGALLVREPRSAGPEVALGAVWDERWRVTGPGEGVVRAVGAVGLAQLPDWRAAGIVRDAALVTPGVWDADRLIAAPLLRSDAEYSATLTAGFGLFLLSH